MVAWPPCACAEHCVMTFCHINEGTWREESAHVMAERT
jgi:hypothetical protein